MSDQLPQANTNEKQNKDEVDRFVNSTGDFARLPQRDGESAVFQFFKDKSKRELATRTFEDPVTHEKTETTKVRYKVLIPDAADQGEKSLETPKMLAQQIEANIKKNHCLLEIQDMESDLALDIL
jgi:hypothetical protein